MEEIFGTSKDGRAMAYGYLKKRYGKEVHFGEINDEKELRDVYNDLVLLSFKNAAKLYREQL